jgi:hypothetical protein
MTMKNQEAAPSVRDAFEAWITKTYEGAAPLEWRHDQNSYREFEVHLAFKAWQAALSKQDAATPAIQELRNIAEAKRFNREHFEDDTTFADWAQSRARHTLSKDAHESTVNSAPVLHEVQSDDPHQGHPDPTRSVPMQAAEARAALSKQEAAPQEPAEPTEGNWISADDYYRNVKALDEALNGPGGATRPLLIDVLSQCEAIVRKTGRSVLSQEPADLLAWAVSRWQAEVSQRPLVNQNRRPLDDTWRQVIRRCGGDPDALLGPSHDELRDGLTTNEWLAMKAAPQEPAEAYISWGGFNLQGDMASVSEARRLIEFEAARAQSVADPQDAMRWIPVSQLPATGAYLTMNNHGQCGVCHYSGHLDAWSTHFGEEVTHWMPLPAPPGAAMALDVTKRDPKGKE